MEGLIPKSVGTITVTTASETVTDGVKIQQNFAHRTEKPVTPRDTIIEGLTGTLRDNRCKGPQSIHEDVGDVNGSNETDTSIHVEHPTVEDVNDQCMGPSIDEDIFSEHIPITGDRLLTVESSSNAITGNKDEKQ